MKLIVNYLVEYGGWSEIRIANLNWYVLELMAL
jgi:hypothetical protein